MKLRRRLFSGISEVSPNGVSYHAAQVTSEYVLDPVENVLYKIEDSPVKDVTTVKRNVGRVKGLVKPINDYIKYKKEKHNQKKSVKKKSNKEKSFSTLDEKLYVRPFLGRSPRIRGSRRSIPGIFGNSIPDLPSQMARSVTPNSVSGRNNIIKTVKKSVKDDSPVYLPIRLKKVTDLTKEFKTKKSYEKPTVEVVIKEASKAASKDIKNQKSKKRYVLLGLGGLGLAGVGAGVVSSKGKDEDTVE